MILNSDLDLSGLNSSFYLNVKQSSLKTTYIVINTEISIFFKDRFDIYKIN